MRERPVALVVRGPRRSYELVVGQSVMCALSRFDSTGGSGQADLGPALDGVVALDGLQQDHAGLLGA